MGKEALYVPEEDLHAAGDKRGRVPSEYAYAAGDDPDLADQIAHMTPEQRAQSAANVQAFMDEVRPQLRRRARRGDDGDV